MYDSYSDVWIIKITADVTNPARLVYGEIWNTTTLIKHAYSIKYARIWIWPSFKMFRYFLGSWVLQRTLENSSKIDLIL
jgi:hypothetical protein